MAMNDKHDWNPDEDIYDENDYGVDKDDLLETVRQDPKILSYWTAEQQTPDLCIAACEVDGDAVAHVKNECQTPEVCEAAVKQNGLALRWINKRPPELCKLAIDQNVEAAQYVYDQTPDMWRYIMNKDTSDKRLQLRYLRYNGEYRSDALTVPSANIDRTGNEPIISIHEKDCNKLSSITIPAESSWICVGSAMDVCALISLEEDSTFTIYNPDKGIRTGMTFDDLQDILDVNRTKEDVDALVRKHTGRGRQSKTWMTEAEKVAEKDIMTGDTKENTEDTKFDAMTIVPTRSIGKGDKNTSKVFFHEKGYDSMSSMYVPDKWLRPSAEKGITVVVPKDSNYTVNVFNKKDGVRKNILFKDVASSVDVKAAKKDIIFAKRGAERALPEVPVVESAEMTTELGE